MPKNSRTVSQMDNGNGNQPKPGPTKGLDTATKNTSQYEEFFVRTADAILILDGETFVDCNQATVDMLRYHTKEELLQTHPSELSPEFQPDGRASFEKANEMIALAFENGNHRFEWNHLRADGSVFPVEVLLTPIPLDERMVLHVVWRDISDRKRLEFELRHAQKIEAVGQLTGGIAHDFNNFLMAIIGYGELLQDELPEGSPGMGYLKQIQLAGDRATELIRHLLAFSRKQVLQPKVVEFNDLIRKIETLLEPVLGEDINFISRYHRESLPVLADSSQLEQVIMNLSTNARDSIPGKGTLVLETFLVKLDEHRIDECNGLSPGSYAVLSVSDTGQGIPPENLDRIFDPFFTTKEVGKGTGLGLSTAHGIIKQSGGEIMVTSNPGQGTVFKVYLPLSNESPLTALPTEKPVSAGGLSVSETILLVEDDLSVSEVVETTLRREGYKVFTATNGRQAMSLVDSFDLKPDLLLTDVIMPEMGGPELVTNLTEHLPDLKVLFTSGYTDSALSHRGGLAEGVELIEKPFTPTVLLKRLREIFD